MVQYGGQVHTDTGMNLNQRLCGLLMVCEVIENRLDGVGSTFRMVVVHLLGVRKSVGDQLC